MADSRGLLQFPNTIDENTTIYKNMARGICLKEQVSLSEHQNKVGDIHCKQ